MRKLFIFCLFLAALLVGCNNNSSDTTELSLQITSSSEMSFDAAGGNATITFSCSDGVEVEVFCAEDWVTNIVVSTSEASFKVEANELSDSRTTQIELRAGDVKASVSIVQSGVENNTPVLPEDSNPSSYDFHHRLLLIDHTGTQCPNCPAVMSGLKALAEKRDYCDKYSLIMVHSYNTTDPAFSNTAKDITTVFRNEEYFKYEKQLTGYPSVTANFWYGYIAGANNFMNMATRKIDELWMESVDASVAASAALVGEQVVVNAMVKTAKERDFHIAAWLMEDGIYAPQSGAREEWQNTHNNAFRECAGVIENGDLSGIDMGCLQAESTTNTVLTIPVKESWDSTKLRVLLIISTPNEDGRFEVINTAICKVGGSVGFEYNK